MASDFLTTTNHQEQCSSTQVPDPVIDNWTSEVFLFEQNSIIKNKLGLIVNKRYQVVQRIDAGAFGSTYIGEDLKNNRQRVAIKFDIGKNEMKKSKKDENHLKYEFEVYKSALYDDGFETIDGFAQVYWFGFQYGHNILVMELLGASVASLFTFCDRKFGWQTVLSLAQQMITRIKHIHQRGFIHRDLKPENFLMGLSKRETTCYLIDFGLARRYRFRHPEDRTLKHIPFRRGRSFIGTAKYASVNSHRSVELSRRDDLESLGYVLIELINGHLPWRNICRRNQNNKHHTYMRIRAAKEQANWPEICPPMAEYMRYCRELQFAEEPNYDKLVNLLRTNLIKEQISITMPNSNSIKCEACRAQDTKDVRLKIDRIEEENSPLVSPPSEPQNNGDGDDQSVSTQPNATYPLLHNNQTDNLTHQLNNINLTSTNLYPKRAYYLPTQACSLTPSVKMSQSSVDNLSQHSSLENLKSNLSANMDLTGKKTNNSEQTTTEEDADSVKSCQNCRQQKQAYFDKEFVSGEKLSWQLWRELTPEHRFNYENRFSWTLPVETSTHFPVQQHYPPVLDFSQPPPMMNTRFLPPTVPLHYQQPYNIPQQSNNQFGMQVQSQNFMGYRPSIYQQQNQPHQQNGFFSQTAPVFCLQFPPPSCGPSFVPT